MLLQILCGVDNKHLLAWNLILFLFSRSPFLHSTKQNCNMSLVLFLSQHFLLHPPTSWLVLIHWLSIDNTDTLPCTMIDFTGNRSIDRDSLGSSEEYCVTQLVSQLLRLSSLNGLEKHGLTLTSGDYKHLFILFPPSFPLLLLFFDIPPALLSEGTYLLFHCWSGGNS